MEIGNIGIARISIIPLRSEPSDKSEMVSQLLFGDHYTIVDISENRNWVKVQMYFDGYEGWMDAKQLHLISNDYFDQINSSDYKICTDISSTILFHKHQTTIVLGSILPIATNELFKVEEQLAFNGESKSLSSKRDAEYVKQTAFKYLNSPYLWGGRSPFGIDCSGFVQIVYRVASYKLPRDAYQQARLGGEIEFNKALSGDLAFFKNEEGRITHVGIVLEDNEIIHASGKVRIDKLSKDGIIYAQSGILTHQLDSIKRILRV